MPSDTEKTRCGVALITGGAAGIGKAIGLTLSRHGYDIGIFDIVPEPLHLIKEITNSGRRAFYVNVDVSSEERVLQGYDLVGKNLGYPDVLVNNAGIYPRSSALEMSYKLWKKVLNTNLGSAFLCSRTVAPAMLEKGSGVIINISSGRGLQGALKGSHYAASKAGVISLTRSLALEWAPTIRVNTIIPGVTDTAQPRQAINSDDELYSRGAQIPLGRIGQPQDVAWAVEYLVSPNAAYITGQSLCVNGGSIMQ